MMKESNFINLKNVQTSAVVSWQRLKSEVNFHDIILVCDDGQLTAHQAVLSAYSSIFRNVLKNNPHQQSIIFLQGINCLDLVYLIDFMYGGKIDIPKEVTDEFLALLKLFDINADFKNEEITAGKVEDFSVVEVMISEVDDEDLSSNYENSMEKKLITKRSKAEKSMNCKDCDSTFTLSSDLQRHTERIHDKAKHSLQCEICEKSFFKDDLKGHMKRVHIKEHPHQCDLCEYSCFKKSQLVIHMGSKHDGFKFSCENCDFQSADIRILKRHTIYRHSDERTFVCEKCSKAFKTKEHLQKHDTDLHGTELFPCVTCGKSFPSERGLKSHEKNHNEDQQLFCDVCKKGFITRTKLKGHLNIHTGEKPFLCPQSSCNKRFTCSSALSHHKNKCTF